MKILFQILATIAVAALGALSLPSSVQSLIEQHTGISIAGLKSDAGGLLERSGLGGLPIGQSLRAPAIPAGAPADFEAAKRLLRPVFARHPVEFYCGCPYNPRTNRIDLAACGADSPVYRNRLARIEFEHVVPASTFGRQRPCWRAAPAGTSGRDHCGETDPEFARMEGDPYNLLPAVGALNAVRSNHNHGEVPGEARVYGQCDFEFDEAMRRAEPPEWAKGDVARVYFYFERRYGLRLSASQRRLFEAWDAIDPINQWEIDRNELIAKAVGWRRDP